MRLILTAWLSMRLILTVSHSQAFETALALDPNYLEAQLYLACALGDMLESDQVSSNSASFTASYCISHCLSYHS